MRWVVACVVVALGCGGKSETQGRKGPVKATTVPRDAGPKVCGKAPSLRWPLRGREGRDWAITNYVDTDPLAGARRDYTGAVGNDAKTYDNHDGVDIDIPSFRQMDRRVPVLAAADGVVVGFDDSQADRNTSCEGKWNYVHVRHDSGYVITYGHLKRGSIGVKKGQAVKAGAVLADVGSSGCSTQPHVHVTVRDCNRKLISPFAAKLWKSSRDYAPPLTLMDVLLKVGGHSGMASLKDPPPDNPRELPRGQLIGFGMTVSGGAFGDTVGFKITRADGRVFVAPSHSFKRAERHTYWYWNYRMPNAPTKLTVEVMLNGDSRWKKTLSIR